MNIRSLTRGDGVVIGAAVLLFIASFLNFVSGPDCSGPYAKVCQDAVASSSFNAWHMLGTVMSIYMAGVIGAAIIVINRALPQQRKVGGLDLGQFGVGLTIFAAWTAFWTIVDITSAGPGIIVGLIAALVLAGAAVAGPLVPALNAALISDKPAGGPSPYGVNLCLLYTSPGAGRGAAGGPGRPGGCHPGGRDSVRLRAVLVRGARRPSALR